MSESVINRRRALALRAFPPRWRDRHADEFLHVSQELSNSSGIADWAECVDIVRGGLAVRLQDRPPLRIRAAYKWIEKPTPSRWHTWMRDDLRGRFLGVRRGLRTMLAIWLVIVGTAVLDGSFRWTRAAAYGSAILVFVVIGGPLQARLTRRRINAKVGYDIVKSDPLAPPGPISVPVVTQRRTPAARIPFAHHAVPFAFWLLVCGTALIAGAAISNAPNRRLGPITFSPDPNSPLSAQQVGSIAIGLGVAVVVLSVAVALGVRWRARSLPQLTIHPSTTLSRRGTWLAATLLGVPVSLFGVVGAAPDLACASIGCVLALVGAALGTAAAVVARRDAQLGRHISLAELLVGERDPAVKVIEQPATP